MDGSDLYEKLSPSSRGGGINPYRRRPCLWLDATTAGSDVMPATRACNDETRLKAGHVERVGDED
jgi:hypothetical protein